MNFRFTTSLSVCLAMLFASVAWTAPPPAKKAPAGQHADGGNWGFKRITSTDPKLPRVLLVGDSIANGYHRRVADKLKGRANVDLFITPKHVGSAGIHDDLKAALAKGPYRVVHFNEAGLHAWPKGAIAEGKYGPLFDQYVKTIQSRAGSATLIWASSTPVTTKGKPGQLDREVNATVDAHNQAARKIVQQRKIVEDDLYALMIGKLALARGDRWHWTKPGSDLQADAVVAAINKSLSTPKRKTP